MLERQHQTYPCHIWKKRIKRHLRKNSCHGKSHLPLNEKIKRLNENLVVFDELPNRLTLIITHFWPWQKKVLHWLRLHGRRQKGKEKPRVHGDLIFPLRRIFSFRHHQTCRSTAGSYPRQDNHRRIQIVVTGRGTRCSVHNNEVTVKDWITRLWQTNRSI